MNAEDNRSLGTISGHSLRTLKEIKEGEHPFKKNDGLNKSLRIKNKKDQDSVFLFVCLN